MSVDILTDATGGDIEVEASEIVDFDRWRSVSVWSTAS